MYLVDKSKQAQKDYEAGIRFKWYAIKMAEILAVLRRNPFEPTPGHRFERLVGNLKGICSRQINHKNRVIYTVFPNTKGLLDEHGTPYEGIVYIFVAWGHDYQNIIT